MNIKILFILFCIATFTACKKEYSVENVQPNPTPQPTSNTEIITTGFAIDNGLEKALYWKDSNYFYVEPLATDFTNASVAEIWNGQLVIAGEYWNGPFTYACYWINGQRYILPTNGSNMHIVLDTKVYNNTLYILVKDEDGGAVVHKLNNINGTNGTDISLNLYTPINIDPTNMIDASNMAFVNNKIIIFGSYRNAMGNDQPCIWQIDQYDQVKHISIPENNTTNFRIFGGDASSNKMYLIGEKSPTSQNSAYIVWTITGKYLEIQTQKATSSIAALWKRLDCKINSKGDMYLLHTNPNPFNADVYTITPQTQALHTTTFTNSSFGFGIDVLGEEYAFGIGNLLTNTNYCGFVQKDNIKIPLKKPRSAQSIYLRGLRIFKK